MANQAPIITSYKLANMEPERGSPKPTIQASSWNGKDIAWGCLKAFGYVLVAGALTVAILVVTEAVALPAIFAASAVLMGLFTLGGLGTLYGIYKGIEWLAQKISNKDSFQGPRVKPPKNPEHEPVPVVETTHVRDEVNLEAYRDQNYQRDREYVNYQDQNDVAYQESTRTELRQLPQFDDRRRQWDIANLNRLLPIVDEKVQREIATYNHGKNRSELCVLLKLYDRGQAIATLRDEERNDVLVEWCEVLEYDGGEHQPTIAEFSRNFHAREIVERGCSDYRTWNNKRQREIRKLRLLLKLSPQQRQIEIAKVKAFLDERQRQAEDERPAAKPQRPNKQVRFGNATVLQEVYS
jgi:hypothetical protein